MSAQNPVVIPAPSEPQAPARATQGTYKVTTPDGQTYEFPGLAYSPDGSITLPSLIDLLLVIVASVDHPTVNKILEDNDVVQKDLKGKLYFPRPRLAAETPQEMNL